VSAVSPIPHEARPHQGRPAGVVTRASAAVVDLVLLLAVDVVGYLAVSGILFLIRPRSFRFPAPSAWLGLGTTLVLLVLYLAVAWSVSGRSHGGQVMGLRVVDRRGRPPRPLIALIRAFVSVLVPIGLLWSLISRERRSIADVICGTSVVYDWRPGSWSGSSTLHP
jgi:uncharacterized RDD family membrane protein YckC